MIRDANKCEVEIYYTWIGDEQHHRGSVDREFVANGYKMKIVSYPEVTRRRSPEYELWFTQQMMDEMVRDIQEEKW